jgi:hypothetical protein
MAAFDVNKICWSVVHDEDFYRRVQEDPEGAIAAYDLSDDERQALLAGDVGRLYELGVSTFLLEHLANWRAFGLDGVSFSASMRAAAQRTGQA